MINWKNENYDKEKIIKKLINFVEKNERKPRGKEYKPEYNLPCMETVIKYFGSLESLHKTCEREISKFEEMEFQKRKKKVIEKVESFMEREKRLPKQSEYQMRKDNLPTLREVTKYFQNMGNLNEECTGIKKIIVREMTEEELILSIQEFYRKNGRLPLKAEFTQENKLPSPNVIKKYYAGISELKNAAGFEIVVPGKK